MKKGRTKEELDTIIIWLTGYTKAQLSHILSSNITYSQFFEDAPHMNEHRVDIKGVICGVRVETIEDPLMRDIRYLDKLVDELAKGKSLDTILRS